MTKKKSLPVKAKSKKTATKQSGFGMMMLSDWRKTLFQKESIGFVIGGFLFIVVIFMLVSFTSHFFTGWMEQSAVYSHSDFEAQNMGGKLGSYTAFYFMDEGFGISAYFIPIFLFFLSSKLMRLYKVRLWKCFLNCGILLVWFSAALSLIQTDFIQTIDFTFNLGGQHGQNVCNYLIHNVGKVTTYAIVVLAAVCYLIYLSSETIHLIRKLMKPHELIKGQLEHIHWGKQKNAEEDVYTTAAEVVDGNEAETDENEEEGKADYNKDYRVELNFSHKVDDGNEPELILDTPATEEEKDTADDQPGEGGNGKPLQGQEPYNPRLDLENYKFPTIDLLKKYPDNSPSVDMAEQNANKDRIITVLRNFGVEIVSIKATIGPTITLYEITPAPGVKISKIRNLEDDIALSLSALGIRIIAPIPGKGTIGIEVPNKNSRIVSMESIINSRKFQESNYELPIALGKTITNEVFMVDLAKMPHLLVAGATGQGKSVGLNAIITSLLYKKHPAELKLVMVDPKKVEFSVYAPIEKHFLAMIPDGDDPIITDVTKVVQTLKSLCQLMDHRYDLLKKAKVRNIKEYNAKFKSRQLNPENGHEFMPYIVVIIDEFGDLIMTAGKEVELPIARIAQLARAVGMHMVIATQRPTTNIITGTIKANFPARMAFKVMSRIDSQTILDRTGANQLVGKGDMLFLSGNDPVRVQCAFVDTPEVEQICNYIADQQGYVMTYELPEVYAEGDSSKANGKNSLENEALDPMFAEAAQLIVVHQQGSTSLIQRKFSIGYNRAGRLMDQLEHAGIVGPTRGAKPREVLCADEVELNAKLSALNQG